MHPVSFLCADVVPYSAHIPSYADIWGWVMVRNHFNFVHLLFTILYHLL